MTAASDQINCKALLSFGSDAGKEEIFLDFTEETTTTGTKRTTISLSLALAATDTQLNLGTYLTDCTYIAVIDRGGTGVKVGLLAGTSNRFIVEPDGFFLLKNGSGTAPILFFDNLSATVAGSISVVAIGT